MTFQIGQFTTKTPDEIRDDYLRTVRNGLIQQGISNPQLGPGSDEYRYATALGNELAPIYANTVIKADAVMPDTATGVAPSGQTVGADLQREMAIYGLAPRGAAPSAGPFTLSCSAPTIIPSGATLIDAAGLRFQVVTSGGYADGAIVQIVAVDAGAASNHNAGDVLTWVSAPPYCASKQIVGSPGQTPGAPALTGGADAENNDTARARLLAHIQDPPGSGNASQTNQFAEDSSTIVQKSFCYPALGGPSTSHVAVVGYASATDKNRDVASSIMTGTVTPYVVGQMPENVSVTVTTVTNQSVDVAIGLTLPSSPQASPPGPGGGWTDGTPWPSLIANTNCQVTAIASSTQFTVNAETSPTAGVSRICVVDTTTWKLLRATVLSVSGTSGAYVITIDTPFPNLVAQNIPLSVLGSFVFPDAVNMDAYVAALLNAFALMGPGEKTSNTSVLGRAFRHPPPQLSWPYSLNATQLKAIESTGDEVLDTSYYFRSATSPTVPGAIADAPYILVPRNLGFYPIV